MNTTSARENSDALTHFAVARAAHLAGDRDLERTAREELKKQGIRLSFEKRQKVARRGKEGVNHAG